MRRFQKILCPVDFSDYSILALRYASALARENDAHLVVYHLIPDLAQTLSYLEGNYIGTVNEALRASAATRTEQFVKSIIPGDQQAEKSIGQGNPSVEILKHATAAGSDLIVMGTHGHTGYERFLIGSTTNRVLHKSTIPVLTVCKPRHHFIQDDQEHPVKIQKILCALDFDSNNRNIADLALDIARKYKAKIHFLHVVPAREAEDWNATEQEARRSFQQWIDPEREKDCMVELIVLAGEPGSVILRTTEQENVDLLVMGHHTRKPIEELFLGSVAKRMVTDSSCPVLVARSSADGD